MRKKIIGIMKKISCFDFLLKKEEEKIVSFFVVLFFMKIVLEIL
jgi:hypothetical protein